MNVRATLMTSITMNQLEISSIRRLFELNESRHARVCSWLLMPETTVGPRSPGAELTAQTLIYGHGGEEGLRFNYYST